VVVAVNTNLILTVTMVTFLPFQGNYFRRNAELMSSQKWLSSEWQTTTALLPTLMTLLPSLLTVQTLQEQKHDKDSDFDILEL